MNNLYNIDLKKLSELPKREGRKAYSAHDINYWYHDWYHTDEYRRVSAIINNSVGMNIGQVMKKIRPLIPPQENMNELLSWKYQYITLDGMVMDRKGRLSAMPAPSRYGSYNSLYVRPDGYIVRINGGKRHHPSNIELARQHETELLRKQKDKQRKANEELKARILLYLINLPSDLKYRRAEIEHVPIGPIYYWCLIKLFMGIYTESYSLEDYRQYAQTIEQQYFEETGIKFKNGKRI